MPIPKAKLTVDGTEIQNYMKELTVTLRENAISSTKFLMTDEDARTFANSCNLHDVVKIELKNRGSTYREVFGGHVTNLQPTVSSQRGYLCLATALGYGVALKRMRVAEEYGTESQRSDLDTIHKILTNGDNGIIDQYIEHVLKTATSSEYTLDDTYIYNETTSLRYVLFPYSPAIDALHSLCDLVSAANYPSAGIHWIVKPITNGGATTPHLCLDVVGNHHAPITTPWPTNVDIGTLEIYKNIISCAFSKQKPDANYVVYCGNFEKPTAEKWTNGGWASGMWKVNVGTGSDDSSAGNYVVGSDSVKHNSTNGGLLTHPASGSMNLNVTKFGTRRSIPSLQFYIKRTSAVTVIRICLGDNTNYYRQTIWNSTGSPDRGAWHVPKEDIWYHVNLPIGPYYQSAQGNNAEWNTATSPNWNDIDELIFLWTSSGDANIWVDDVRFTGIVTRGAKSNTEIVAQGCHIKLISDSLAKDDSIIAADDTGMVSQLAKAELIRAMTTPLMGRITIEMAESVLPGQIVHVHAEKKSDGTFTIDDDFRILQVQHCVTANGAITNLDVTDDVINGYARIPTNAYNAIVRASNPDFQDRNRGDLIASKIDILQNILEVNY